MARERTHGAIVFLLLVPIFKSLKDDDKAFQQNSLHLLSPRPYSRLLQRAEQPALSILPLIPSGQGARLELVWFVLDECMLDFPPCHAHTVVTSPRVP